MNKAVLCLLLSGAFALTGNAMAREDETKNAYRHAVDNANADFRLARERCKDFKSLEKNICEAEAKAMHERAKAVALVDYEGTPKAEMQARKAIADADYDLARAKCGGLAGNEKGVCMKAAAAAHTSDIADAAAARKIVEAAREAIDAKMNANYKVAMEMCDALKGAEKEKCTTTAKTEFNK
jgi:hypothetical protein